MFQQGTEVDPERACFLSLILYNFQFSFDYEKRRHVHLNELKRPCCSNATWLIMITQEATVLYVAGIGQSLSSAKTGSPIYDYLWLDRLQRLEGA